MYEIINKQELAQGTIVKFDINAPQIANKIQAGQFVIIRVNETGERIPITVADADKFAGYITIIFQVVGKTTALMRSLKTGESIKDLTGPLGKPSEITKEGSVIVVGGGTGVAILHHTAKALKKAGNYLIGIIGARSKDLLILEEEMDSICDELIVTTDDGSHGTKAFVTHPLEKILTENEDIKKVYAVGPIVMMRNVCNLTQKYNNIQTIVSLNPIMIDGTGMCGGCRVTVGGKTSFCCVHGPEFDGHKVDFDELEKRNAMYAFHEKNSLLYSVE